MQPSPSIVWSAVGSLPVPNGMYAQKLQHVIHMALFYAGIILPFTLSSHTFSTSIMANQTDGIAGLTYQRALDIARNTEGTLNPEVAAYLDQACVDISNRINAEPDSYILTKDEFAVFNFYRSRFSGVVAEAAVERFWRNG